jgi:mRNA interferase YafQ
MSNSAIKYGYDMNLLKKVLKLLEAGKPLPEKYFDHPLSGIFKGCRECHILPDWLLIYEYSDDDVIIYLTRTGTHSDLFKS